MSKLTQYTIGTVVVTALLSLAACASVKPENVITQVSKGMTQTDVIRHVGPPDREYAYAGNECFQYALGDDSRVPFAVYFDGQHRVAATSRTACPGVLR